MLSVERVRQCTCVGAEFFKVNEFRADMEVVRIGHIYVLGAVKAVKGAGVVFIDPGVEPFSVFIRYAL